LAEQKAPSDTTWEVLLIDNASTDDTALVAKVFWDKNGNVPLRIIREETPGLSHARERAFREAKYEIISFIDDDNWVCVDWVARVVSFFREHPKVGAVGARGHEVTEGVFPLGLPPSGVPMHAVNNTIVKWMSRIWTPVCSGEPGFP